MRTANNPVGDIAEAIVHEHYGGTRGSFSQKGWDVQDLAGRRLQVKGMRRAGQRGRRNLSAIRDSDYDLVVIVVFDPDFILTTALEVPREVVEELFAIRHYVNGRIITVTDGLLRHPNVSAIDMTAAYERLGALGESFYRVGPNHCLRAGLGLLNAVTSPTCWIGLVR
ncbi:hypothetical protein [Rhodococcoides fascians]|uniref:hypothetical protein n=1 Tax=Rhodococcoides fascians TaxID=1828 RepID=UPI000BD4A50E|nr:hypothetical protein [Rhodococcus fascians]OZF13325.1 hypothetical protein CH297_27320 [Rhodococcus fascians]